jgi:hypothetical protein
VLIDVRLYIVFTFRSVCSSTDPIVFKMESRSLPMSLPYRISLATPLGSATTSITIIDEAANAHWKRMIQVACYKTFQWTMTFEARHDPIANTVYVALVPPVGFELPVHRPRISVIYDNESQISSDSFDRFKFRLRMITAVSPIETVLSPYGYLKFQVLGTCELHACLSLIRNVFREEAGLLPMELQAPFHISWHCI